MADTLNNNFFDKGLPQYTEENGSKLPASLRSFDGGSILILNEAERMDTFLSLFVVLQLMVNRHPVSKRYYDELCLNEHGISNPNPCYQKVFDQLQGAKEKMNTISEPLYTSNNHLRNKRSPNRRRSNMPRGVNRPSRMNKHYPKQRGVTGYINTKRPGNRWRLNKPRGVKRPTRRPSRKGITKIQTVKDVKLRKDGTSTRPGIFTETENLNKETKSNGPFSQLKNGPFVKGHIIHKSFGGSGTNKNNLVSLTRSANKRHYEHVEKPVKNSLLKKKKVSTYSVEPVFSKKPIIDSQIGQSTHLQVPIGLKCQWKEKDCTRRKVFVANTFYGLDEVPEWRNEFKQVVKLDGYKIV